MTAGLTREQQLWRWRILTSTYIGYIGFYLTRKAFTICKKPIADTQGWDMQGMARIWAAFLIAYMIGQFINGFAGRKYGPRIILLGGLGISILVNFVFGIANSYATFMVFMFINGLVQATGWPGCVGAVSAWMREHERGTIMGWWTTNHIVGNIVYKSIGGLLLGYLGWRWAFTGLTALTLITWWLLYLWQHDKLEEVGLDPMVAKRDGDSHAVQGSQEDSVSFREYMRIALNPLVLTMGVSYLCIKFMRYALDSWLPSFLNIQGLPPDQASYWSMGFDLTGVVGTVVAGWALDRIFKGNWAILSFIMALGAIVGYVAVIYAGSNPIMVALCFSIVGFMIYGPDSLLTGAAAIAVAGEMNGVAVAGIVNAIGSAGPVVQELWIGKLMTGSDMTANIRNSNILTLAMSVVFAVLMIVVAWRLHIAHKQRDARA